MTAHIKKTTEEIIETINWHEQQEAKLKAKIIKELRSFSRDGLIISLDEATKIVEQA